MKQSEGIRELRRLGIKTEADLDQWIFKQTRPMSRYGALVELVGEPAATWILNDLAISQCCGAPYHD